MQQKRPADVRPAGRVRDAATTGYLGLSLSPFEVPDVALLAGGVADGEDDDPAGALLPDPLAGGVAAMVPVDELDDDAPCEVEGGVAVELELLDDGVLSVVAGGVVAGGVVVVDELELVDGVVVAGGVAVVLVSFWQPATPSAAVIASKAQSLGFMHDLQGDDGRGAGTGLSISRNGATVRLAVTAAACRGGWIATARSRAAARMRAPAPALVDRATAR
jgi:hypothetical protein